MSLKKRVHPLMGMAWLPSCARKKRRVGRKRISTREKQKSPALTCFVKDTAGGFLAMCEAGTHHTHTKSIPEEEGADNTTCPQRERDAEGKTHTHTNFRGSRCPKNVVVVERGGGEKHKAGWTYPLRERKNPFFSPSRTHHTDARTIPNLGRDR